MEDRPGRVGVGVGQLGSLALVLDTQVDDVLAALLAAPLGLVVTGVPESGRSAAVGQVLRRLRADGWAVAAHVGRWFPSALFYAVAEALDLSAEDFPLRGPSFDILTSPAPATARLDAVCTLLERSPLAVAFDDVDQNMADPGFAAVFGRLCAAGDRGRVIVTCRDPLPDGVPLRSFPYAPTTHDAVRLAARLPTLSELDDARMATVIALLGGQPRLLVLADSWLTVGGQDRDDAYVQFLAAVTGAQPPAGLRGALLDLHLSLLNPVRKEALLHAATCTFPRTARDIAVACDTRARTVEERHSPDAADIEAVDAAAHRLIGLGLATGVSDTELFVDRWIAEGLLAYQGEEGIDRHERAILMHYAEIRGQRNKYGDMVAIVRHLVAVGGFADLTKFALDVTPPAASSLDAAALLGYVVPVVPVDHPRLPDLVERQVARLRESGLPEAAREAADRYRQRVRDWVETVDPQDGERLAFAYERLGDAARLAGDAAETERAHLRSLALRKSRFEADTNADTLRALCRSFERLADIVRDLGGTEDAERYYRTCLAAAEAMARAHPDDEDVVAEYERARLRLSMIR